MTLLWFHNEIQIRKNIFGENTTCISGFYHVYIYGKGYKVNFQNYKDLQWWQNKQMPKLKGYTSIMQIDLGAWYLVSCLEK